MSEPGGASRWHWTSGGQSSGPTSMVVLLGIRAVAPIMRRRGGGSIVVISSVAGLTSAPEYAAYVTSKTAVLGLVRSAAVDLGPDLIRVSAVCPGWTRTEMSERETELMAQKRE